MRYRAPAELCPSVPPSGKRNYSVRRQNPVKYCPTNNLGAEEERKKNVRYPEMFYQLLFSSFSTAQAHTRDTRRALGGAEGELLLLPVAISALSLGAAAAAAASTALFCPRKSRVSRRRGGHFCTGLFSKARENVGVWIFGAVGGQRGRIGVVLAGGRLTTTQHSTDDMPPC